MASRLDHGSAVPDLVEVHVPAGGRVLVVSDLHLGKDATASSSSATAELARAIEAWGGPGVVIFAGDLFELIATDDNTPERSLAAHSRLAAATRAFLGEPGRRVICLPGNHDGRLAWDDKAGRSLCLLLGSEDGRPAELGLAVELSIDTGQGTRRVRVEHGHQLDPANAFADPRNPLDTPLGHHLAHDVIPGLQVGGKDWLEGVEDLADPAGFPLFAASRLSYRRLGRHLGWLLLPVVLAFALKIPLVFALVSRTGGGERVVAWSHRLVLIGAAAVVDVVVMIAVARAAFRSAWKLVSAIVVPSRGRAQNDNARDLARRLAVDGYAGLITGHTHHPELSLLGVGFYANTGCCSEVVEARPARFGLPPVFLGHRLLSWVELEAGADLHVRLLQGRLDLPGGTRVERLVARRAPAEDPRPTVVASCPRGPSWPTVADPAGGLRRTRRVAAVAIALAGLVNLVSAFTPPARQRVRALLEFVPLAVPTTAAALVALAGLGLLLLSGGVRRGQRRAWSVAVALLAGSAALHLAKGVDLEEAVTAVVVALYLVRRRGAFRASSDPSSLRRGVVALAAGAAGAAALGTLVVEVGPGRRLPIGHAVAAVAGRLVGIEATSLPDGFDDFLAPVLGALGLGLALFAGWLAFRPVVLLRRRGTGGDLARARGIVDRHGSGTLSYFALRADKRHFFSGDSVVAYGVFNGVCLVSPDPIGPAAERAGVWAEFRRFVDGQSWALAVLGAAEEWLPVYRASGMHDLYVGDEGVTDCGRFHLDGGRHKGLRQAVNRVAKYGYRVEFHDPARVGPEMRAALLDVMTRSRKGDVERGFSMTLGRVFDPADTGLLLAVCLGPGGEPVAFCQYVPAPAIDGYSLDLMRRDNGDHPNGIIDFVLVETIRHLRDRGMRGLGLNFATMRAVIAGEAGDGLPQRMERWVLRHLSDSMQIESLWRFNAKFDPDWQPRYAVYDAPEHMLAAALAVARAESFWELPLIGRFLVPDPEPALVAGPASPEPVGG